MRMRVFRARSMLEWFWNLKSVLQMRSENQAQHNEEPTKKLQKSFLNKCIVKHNVNEIHTKSTFFALRFKIEQTEKLQNIFLTSTL